MLAHSPFDSTKLRLLVKPSLFLGIALLWIIVSIAVFSDRALADADIPCSKYGYKIIRRDPATIYKVDPDNPTPQVYLSNIPIRTSAFGYSYTYQRFYATALDDTNHTVAGHLYMIDGNGNLTEVNTGGVLLGKIGMDISVDGYIYVYKVDDQYNKTAITKLKFSNATTATYITDLQGYDVNSEQPGADIAIHPHNGQLYSFIKDENDDTNKIRIYDKDDGHVIKTYTLDLTNVQQQPPNAVEAGSQWFDGQGRLYTWLNHNFGRLTYHLWRFTFDDVNNVAKAEDLGPIRKVNGRGDGAACQMYVDIDHDGIADVNDLDDDNDGIPDMVESPNGADPSADNDRDGVLAYLDDDDSDAAVGNDNGQIEAGYDVDGDGVPNYLDLDSDNDGIPDAVEAQPTNGYQGNDGDVSDDVDANGVPPYEVTTPQDTDGDGTPDYLDTDSDGDGPFDVNESGLFSSDPDADDDGRIDTLIDNNNDGADDSVNTSYQDPDGNINNPLNDLKNDDRDNTEPDYRSVNNAPEATNDLFVTAQNNPVNGNIITGNNGYGTDSDADRDNLKIQDFTVNGMTYMPSISGTTVNLPEGDLTIKTDGSLIFTPVQDFSGPVPIINYTLTDGNEGTDSAEIYITVNPDTDGDGLTNNEDPDDDNDGIPDNVEYQCNSYQLITSSDLNILANSVNYTMTSPLDVSGILGLPPNSVWVRAIHANTTSSGAFVVSNTLHTVFEFTGTIPVQLRVNHGRVVPAGKKDQVFSLDNNIYDFVSTLDPGLVSGINNIEYYVENTTSNVITNSSGLSWKSQGFVIRVEMGSTNERLNNGISIALCPANDSDGDGIADIMDIDSDNDGIPDIVENNGNPNLDTDNDGIPDRLDLDSDGDGILDIEEANGIDSDGDGRVDDDTDSDNDGLADVVDSNPYAADNPSTITDALDVTTLPVPDTDGDGKRDFQDVDSDNDGISDLVEGGINPSLDRNNDGVIDDQTDTDRDGIADEVDPDNGGTPADTPDTDGDGVDNYRDLDSDNDGLYDVKEALGQDYNGDGLIDTPDTLIDPNSIPDEDGDGVPDQLDLPAPVEVPTLSEWGRMFTICLVLLASLYFRKKERV